MHKYFLSPSLKPITLLKYSLVYADHDQNYILGIVVRRTSRPAGSARSLTGRPVSGDVDLTDSGGGGGLREPSQLSTAGGISTVPVCMSPRAAVPRSRHRRWTGKVGVTVIMVSRTYHCSGLSISASEPGQFKPLPSWGAQNMYRVSHN